MIRDRGSGLGEGSGTEQGGACGGNGFVERGKSKGPLASSRGDASLTA